MLYPDDLKPFICTHCHTEIGQANTAILILPAAPYSVASYDRMARTRRRIAFVDAAEVECPRCKRLRKWVADGCTAPALRVQLTH